MMQQNKWTYDYDFEKIHDDCPYCGREAGSCRGRNCGFLLPDREFQMSRWHKDCMINFIVANLDLDENTEEYRDYIAENLYEVFPNFIKRANEREEKYRYHQVVITQ